MTSEADAPAALADDKPVTIALLAMGGQGGGVLSDWIVAVAESQGWAAQSTSVPGVAQRTGATIYYIETLPARPDRRPVLSLMPTPGDVDVVMASEWMEAGRSVLRGLVTPERTTLIASTHRAFAVAEKEKPGDGLANSGAVVDAGDVAALRLIAFDMEALALANGSVISAAMLGALAAADVLPFPREAYEAIVREGGKSANASLSAFAAAYDKTRASPREAPPAAPAKRLDALPDDAGHPELNRLVQRIRSEFPASAHPMLFVGVKRAVDFQDIRYGNEYLDAVKALHALDVANSGAGREFEFTREAAKYVAIAMAYDDVIRVADLKTRPERFQRIRSEMAARPGQVLEAVEFFHPRMQEICGALPAGLGRWIERRPALFGALDRFVSRGRRIRSTSLVGFAMLYFVAALRPRRRGMLRHSLESEHREAWLYKARHALPLNYDLAVETLRCRRLVKGYSDTHDRGLSKFDRTLAQLPRLEPRPDGAAWLRRLRQAALKDEAGTTLDGVIRTIATL